MDLDIDAVDRDAFVRSYNRRRFWAKASVALCAAGGVVGFAEEFLGARWDDPRLLAGLAACLAGFVWTNYIMGHCPFCRRYIGFRSQAGVKEGGLPRGAPCALETELADRLDLPDR